MSEIVQMPIRIPQTDRDWLKEFVGQYPGDTLNAMMTRFIRTRIEELCAVEDLDTPEFTPDISSADIFSDGYIPSRPHNAEEK